MQRELDSIGKDDHGYEKLALKVKNEIYLLEIKLIKNAKFLDKVLYSLTSISLNSVNQYFDLFDAVSFFLITYKDYIDVGLFTDLTFLLIKKNAQKRNEDLLYIYRQKIENKLGNLTIAHL